MSHDIELEVLGRLILDNSLVKTLMLEEEHFASMSNRTLYAVIAKLVNRGEPADVGTITDEMMAKTGVDFLSTIAGIANSVPGPSNAIAYANKLKKISTIRRARAVGAMLDGIEDPSEIESCLSRLIAISHIEGSSECTQSEAIARAIEHLEALADGKASGLPTGITALDEKLGGLQNSDLIVIGARSQHGKTALMLQIANNQKVPVGIISGEQPHVQLGMRSIAQLGSVSLRDMRTGRLSEAQWKGVNKAVHAAHDQNIFIFDKGNPSISEIEATARQWKFHNGIQCLFIDYLQLISGGDGGEHRLQIGDVVYRLKGLAKQLEIPIVALAQVARAIDAAPADDDFTGRMPFANHLADSAKIEDAADQIITLYRPEVYWPKNHSLRGTAYLNVCKNRHGPVGYFDCRWHGEFVSFTDTVR